MPANALRWPAAQEQDVREQENPVTEELEACRDVQGTGKNRLKRFLLEMGIRSIAEMDYPLRQTYENYLKNEQNIQRTDRYLMAYDRVKQYSVRQQMQTLAGRQQCRWQMDNSILFIPYHPDQTLAMEFDSVRNKSNMVWDFSRPCPQMLKEQIFTALNAIIARYKEPRRREHRLTGLQYLYDFCVEADIGDIAVMDGQQTREFGTYLDGRTNSASRKEQLQPSLNYCRKAVFLQDREIRWDANVWYVERLNLPKNRVNPSGSHSGISFLEIADKENRRFAKEYMKYQIGLTGMAVSTIIIKYEGIRNFLTWLDERGWPVCGCTAEQMNGYIKEMQDRQIIAKTFNEYLAGLQQFFNFLVVRGYMDKVPVRIEYYQKKMLPRHHDRSVPAEVCTEMLSRLHLLPEHLRCMYLHLWCLGLRISEVCTLKGDAYYRQGEDTWIQVYQIKLKKYKRIPIAEGLYKIMQVYIRRHGIGPDDYLFTNRDGGAYRSATFSQQMKKFCREQEVEGGEYLFKSHDYRHTVATMFYDSGVSLQSVRDYLGHSYEEMTQQYLDYMPMKIAKKNEEFFRQPGNSLSCGLKKGENDG